jgi:hypothetical protein
MTVLTPKNKELLRQNGWIEVKSELHAYQLIRRELKLRARLRHRNPKLCAGCEDVLGIKPGVWVKLLPSWRWSNRRTIIF